MNQLLFVEKTYHELSIDCKLRKIHFLTESAALSAYILSPPHANQKSAFTTPQISFSTVQLSIQSTVQLSTQSRMRTFMQPMIQIIDDNNEHFTEHSDQQRHFSQSFRRSVIFLFEKKKFEKILIFQNPKHQQKSQNVKIFLNN